MLQAELVPDEAQGDVPQAQVFDTDKLVSDALADQQKKERKRNVLVAIFGVLLIVAVIVTATTLATREDKGSSDQEDVTNTAPPQDEETVADMPTMDPDMTAQEYIGRLLENDPEAADSLSPTGRAIEWLLAIWTWCQRQ